jgi:segregation and condensation protein B
MDEGMTEEFEQQKTELTDIQDENSVADDTASAPQSPSQDITTESVIEAILFASDEPISAERLVNIAEFNGGVKQVKKCIETLNEQYAQSGRAFRIEEIAGGFQMMTLPEYNNWLKNLLRQRADNKLSPAALETLAIIAYKQPIIRADVEAIRGVACGEMLRSLMYKGLVKIVGKAEVLGRPLLYGTTKKFLEIFGLSDLKDLPKAEELKQPGQ